MLILIQQQLKLKAFLNNGLTMFISNTVVLLYKNSYN